jgi:transcription antitermination factor NusG
MKTAIKNFITRIKLPKEEKVSIKKTKKVLTLKELSHEYFNAGHL